MNETLKPPPALPAGGGSLCVPVIASGLTPPLSLRVGVSERGNL